LHRSARIFGARLFPPAAGGKGALAFRTFFGAFTGAWTFAARAGEGAAGLPARELVCALRPGTDPRTFLDAAAVLANDAHASNLLGLLGGNVTKANVSAQRMGDTLLVRAGFDLRGLPPPTKEKLIALLGAERQEVRLAVARDRLLVVAGPDAGKRLAALRASLEDAREIPPALTDALRAAKGGAGLGFVSLTSLARAASREERPGEREREREHSRGKKGEDEDEKESPVTRFLLTSPVPASLHGSYHGGERLSFKLSAPVGALAAAAAKLEGAFERGGEEEE
jgi:hypothetical protein